MLLVWLRLNIARRTFSAEQTSETFRERLKRIDFIGITLVVAIIVAFLMPLSLGGNQVPWSHPVIPGLFLGSAVLGACFAYVESRIAEEPIFPLQLLTRRDVVLPYTVHLLQNLAQSIVRLSQSPTARIDGN